MAALAELHLATADTVDWQPLAACTVGWLVRIEQIDEDDDDSCRLRELGLYEGACVEVVGHADPVVLSVFGNRIAVCRRCAELVAVSRVVAAN